MIEWVDLQLVPIRSAYLDVEILPYDNLDAFWRIAEASVVHFEHTVALDRLPVARKATRGVGCSPAPIGPMTDD